MDSESQQVTNQSTQQIDLEFENDNSHHHLEQQPYTSCVFCRRAFLLETETSESFEAIFICRDCKLVVLDDLDTDTTSMESSRRRQARTGSSESFENMFAQQFTEMVGLVRQSHEAQQRSGHSVSSSTTRRWHQPPSDNGSESLDLVDYLFGDSGSVISFTGNGIESDTSVEDIGFVRENLFIRRDDDDDDDDEESNISSDTDIDPMHAGQDHWNSEGEDDEENEWEEDNVAEADGEFVGHGSSSSSRQVNSIGSSPVPGSDGDTGNDGWLLMTTRRRMSMRHPNIFNDMEEPELPQFVGNADDYLDARGFGTLLEQLAETDSARSGPPPAATSCVRTLPRVVISKVHEKKNGSLVCAVCKDNLPVGTETNCLPCSHFYHPSCILPWLRTRNTCPVCRYELPTDDTDYEGGKRGRRRNVDRFGNHEENNNFGESSSARAHTEQADESRGFNQQERDQDDDDDDNDEVGEDGTDTQQRRRGWSYLAAATTPIVSIAGMALVMWIGASLADRQNHDFHGHDSDGRNSAGGTTQANTRQRRWWSLF